MRALSEVEPMRPVSNARPADQAGAARGGQCSPPEGPRERLLRAGRKSLSDRELLAILLGTGTRGRSVLQLAEATLQRCGGLAGLRFVAPEDLTARGLGPAKAARVLASIEIAARLAATDTPRHFQLDQPAASARYLFLRYARRDQEVMGAVYLDVRNRVIADRELFKGTLRRASVEPRPILREALSLGAAAVVVFHTHPSGDPSPSAEDAAFTERLAQAASAVGLHLADHLILGSGSRWVSLRAEGVIRQ